MAFDHEINPKIKNNVARIRTEVKYDFFDDITALNFRIEWLSFIYTPFTLLKAILNSGAVVKVLINQYFFMIFTSGLAINS